MRDHDGDRETPRDVLDEAELAVYAAQHGGPTWPLTAGTCSRCGNGGIRLDHYLCWHCAREVYVEMGGAA
jgi:ribosomal protein S27AE